MKLSGWSIRQIRERRSGGPGEICSDRDFPNRLNSRSLAFCDLRREFLSRPKQESYQARLPTRSSEVGIRIQNKDCLRAHMFRTRVPNTPLNTSNLSGNGEHSVKPGTVQEKHIIGHRSCISRGLHEA